MPTDYDAYLFDLDGTLVDTAPDIMKGLNYALAQAGFDPVGESLTRHWVGHGARVLIERALEHYGEAAIDETAMAVMVQDFIDHYAEHIADDSLPYPGVVETLERLNADGKRLGVVTNKAIRLSRLLLSTLDLKRFFGIVVGGDTMQVSKPAAEPALYAINELNVTPERTLFVGDAATDVGCARAAGCPVVCFRDGYNQGIDPETLGADRVIDSLRDLV